MLRHKPAQQIFDSVAQDFRVYDDQNQIEWSTLIKVIKECNSTLSLKINFEAEAIIDVVKYKAKLPDNFETLNFALLCTKRLIETTPAKGFQIEQKSTCNKGAKCSVCLEECDTDYKVIQKCDKEWTEFGELDVVKIVNTSIRKLSEGNFNLMSKSFNEIKLQGDYVNTNFENGVLYINYVTNMVNDEGELMVLDHPMVQSYYELACKSHILSNLHYNNDDDVVRKMQQIDFKLSIAERKAITFINAIEYDELMGTFIQNRKKFNKRFVEPFNQEISRKPYFYR